MGAFEDLYPCCHAALATIMCPITYIQSGTNLPTNLIGGSNENETYALQPYHFCFDRLCLRIRNTAAPVATTAPVIPVTGLSTDTPAAVMPSGPAAVNVGQNAA